jgi:hypothetical protein
MDAGRVHFLANRSSRGVEGVKAEMLESETLKWLDPELMPFLRLKKSV